MTPEELKKRAIEFKTFAFDIQEAKEIGDGKEAIIEGYASTFGNMDQGFDIVSKGAFKATIKATKGKFPILADHNPHEQIGWNEEASEDETGLLVRGALVLDVRKAVERLALAKKALAIKARAGLSIGYSTIKSEPDQSNTRVRILKELKLWEYSFVTFPMNTEALITAAKSVGAIDNLKTLIETLKAEGVKLKDLEIALRKEAADADQDPTKISQSIDSLILKFKS